MQRNKPNLNVSTESSQKYKNKKKGEEYMPYYFV